LYFPLGLEVLFLPPNERNVVRDLDNVMRRIVPEFANVFATSISREHEKDYPHRIIAQIVDFEILRVPSGKADRPAGQVAIALGEGIPKRDLLHRTQAVIEAWEKDLDD
jgi:hypothetical protein